MYGKLKFCKIKLLLCFSIFSFALAPSVYSFSTNNYSEYSIKSKKKIKKFSSLNEFLPSIEYAPLNNSSYKNEFNANYLNKTYPIDSVTNRNLQKARAAFVDLDNSNSYVNFFSPNDMALLPIGIKKEIGNITYSMGITKAQFLPGHSVVTAFVRIIIPQMNQNSKPTELFFGAENIKLSHKGGLYETANLFLLGDVPIPINDGTSLLVLKGSFDMELGNIDSQSYVSINCEGFKEMGMAADVIFPRSMLEPVDEDHMIISNPSVKVAGHFKTVINDWNNILAEISLPPFQLTKPNSNDKTGKAGVIFELNTAVFDFSDFQNSPDIEFPEGYEKYLIPGNEKLWRGVYINSLRIILPEYFRKKNKEERVSFQANHLLIDGMGVSGSFSVDNILSLSEGEASKWQFSVEYFELDLLTNNIVGAGISGEIVLPTSKEVLPDDTPEQLVKKTLGYEALIDPINENYLLTVTIKDKLDFPLFGAELELASNSYVELRVEEKRFKPKAVLYGKLNIGGGLINNSPENTMVNFQGVTFQNLQLQTESPYFQVDYMGYEGKLLFANFPVTISKIGLMSVNDVAHLDFDFNINFMGENNGFAGNTSISIFGKLNHRTGLHRWEYQRIETHQIALEVDLGKIEMKGNVEIKNDDPTYGNGFYGELTAVFNDITVSASAWFGKTDFRYWYVDAFADLSNSNVKVRMGPLNVNGFGGGAYYHMSRKSNASPVVYDGIKIKTGPPSPSGLDYTPDINTNLGFRALMGFALDSESSFNGKVGFEMSFNRSGGLNRVFFFGEGHVMKPFKLDFGGSFKDKLTELEKNIEMGKDNPSINDLKNSDLIEYSKKTYPQDGLTFDAGIDAYFSMEMDFQNRVFHSEMEVYINTPGNFFSGIGSKGRAGWAVFHAAPDQWYIHIGTPKDRLGLRLGINELSLKTTSYLMMGDNIPGSPPPPAIVADILGVKGESLDYMRELNALGNGRGFAFGTSFDIDTGDMTFLFFYARFQAGLGFDIMVKDYGQSTCKGRGVIGINGWYANGQAYAYLQGELGIHVRLFVVNKKIPIIKAGAAILLQAKLPNPAWFRGYLGGHFQVLGGLVKGKFRFKVEIGEECELVNGGPLGGLKIISDLSPRNNANNVDVFTSPQVAFNMKINTPFELEDDEGVKTYRILLKEFKVLEKGIPIRGKLEWNQNNDAVNFVSFDVLPPKKTLKVSVNVSFQEKRDGNWISMSENGKVAQEQEERTFTTGEAPDNIPLRNISYCYPVIDQKYFHKNERNSGYIKLKRGQGYLFHPESDWQQSLQVISASGSAQKTNSVSYNASNQMVKFNLPQLENKQKYIIKMISKAPKQQNLGDQNNRYSGLNTGQQGNSIQIRNREAQTTLQEDLETELITYSFATSRYNTFAEKINAKEITGYVIDIVATGVYALEANGASPEPFDLIELKGSAYTNFSPLIQTEAILTDSYYKNKIHPLLYENYPLESGFTVNRNTNLLGLPPKKAIEVLPAYIFDLEYASNNQYIKNRIPYRYNLNYYYKQDYIDIISKIVNAYSQTPDRYQRYNYLINGIFPLMPNGIYPVKMSYLLPGGIKGSSNTLNFIKKF